MFEWGLFSELRSIFSIYDQESILYYKFSSEKTKFVLNFDIKLL